jgi:hypothetical protein
LARRARASIGDGADVALLGGEREVEDAQRVLALELAQAREGGEADVLLAGF